MNCMKTLSRPFEHLKHVTLSVIADSLTTYTAIPVYRQTQPTLLVVIRILMISLVFLSDTLFSANLFCNGYIQISKSNFARFPIFRIFWFYSGLKHLFDDFGTKYRTKKPKTLTWVCLSVFYALVIYYLSMRISYCYAEYSALNVR